MQALSITDQFQRLFERGLIYPNKHANLSVEIKRGMAIVTRDGQNTGRVAAVILENDGENATHILLSPGSQASDYRLASVNLIKQVQIDKETLVLHINSQTAKRLSQQETEQALMVEPLTRRELEVLLLIESGLSNREIADKLVISTGTAKKHISNIYGKLGVNRRIQAVAMARNLKLL